MTAREVYNQTFDDSTLLANNEDRGSWPNVEAIPVGNDIGREKFCCTDAMADYGVQAFGTMHGGERRRKGR